MYEIDFPTQPTEGADLADILISDFYSSDRETTNVCRVSLLVCEALLLQPEETNANMVYNFQDVLIRFFSFISDFITFLLENVANGISRIIISFTNLFQRTNSSHGIFNKFQKLCSFSFIFRNLNNSFISSNLLH